MKNLLVIVDMQNDFVDGSLANNVGQKVVDNVTREIDSGEYDYFVLTRDSHPNSYLNSLEGKNLPIEHCIIGSKGWDFNEKVISAVNKSGINYSLFDKNGFGTFEANDLIAKYEDEIQNITILGLCTDICVVTIGLILRAKFPNIPMYFVEDACGGTSHEAHKAALEIMKSCQIYSKY